MQICLACAEADLQACLTSPLARDVSVETIKMVVKRSVSIFALCCLPASLTTSTTTTPINTTQSQPPLHHNHTAATIATSATIAVATPQVTTKFINHSPSHSHSQVLNHSSGHNHVASIDNCFADPRGIRPGWWRPTVRACRWRKRTFSKPSSHGRACTVACPLRAAASTIRYVCMR